ncbi:hypothetical protein [Streptosporangium sp. KLBMP 9127]|nr:hypothetical protein [Streptosporangium sp. KLBMP 9127]
MARLGPLLTLAAGGSLAVALGVLSVTATPGTEPTAAGALAPAASAPGNTPVDTNANPSPKAAKTAKPTPIRADFAGRVKGNQGLIAVSVRNGKAIAYFCDGKIEAWFKGKAKDGAVELDGFGDSSVTARLKDGRASGEIELGRQRWDFSASTARKPSGLYRASAIIRGARLKSGWIVLADGTQTGFTSLGEKQVPTPTLTPGADPTIDGERVEAKDVDGFIEEMTS